MSAGLDEEQVRQIAREELAAELRKYRRQLRIRKPWTAFKSFDSVFHHHHADVQSSHLSSELVDDLITAWHGHVLTHLSGGGQNQPGGLHRLRNVVEHGRERIRLIVHSILPTLHGLVTRYVAGALPAARRWLHRMGWVRRAAASSPRPSGTTNGGDAA